MENFKIYAEEMFNYLIVVLLFTVKEVITHNNIICTNDMKLFYFLFLSKNKINTF